MTDTVPPDASETGHGFASSVSKRIVCVAVVIAAVATCSALVRDVRDHDRRTRVPSDALMSGRLGKSLALQNLVLPVREDTTTVPDEGDTDKVFFRARRAGSDGLPARDVVEDRLLKSEWPLLSVVVARDDLRGSERGLFTHPDERGSEWERLAYLTYFENGREVFSTGAGLRIHGGKHRLEDRSFRLHFRWKYGAGECPSALLPGSAHTPLETIVLRYDSLYCMKLASTVAYDFARRIGAEAPESKLVRLCLNGKRYGNLHEVTMHMSRRNWREILGHDEFDLYVPRSANESLSEHHYRELKRWTLDPHVDFTMASVDARVDLDNLSRHLLSFVFCGTTDWRQGAALRVRRSEGRWQWVHWDMDQSFSDLNRAKSSRRRNSEQEAMALLTTGRRYDRGGKAVALEDRDVRELIFQRLWADSREFKEAFIDLVTEMLNHRLDAAFLDDRVRYYQEIGRYKKTRSLRRLTKFVAERPAFIRRELCEEHGAPPFIEVTVECPSSARYEVDAYSKNNDYTGWHPAGSSLQLGTDDERFSHWLVGSTRCVTQPVTAFEVTTNMVIRLVLSDRGGSDAVLPGEGRRKSG